jgi:lipid A 4'-phosphatase
LKTIVRPLFVILLTCGLVALGVGAFVLWPQMDLAASGLFYTPGRGFFLRDVLPVRVLGWLVYYGARALGGALAVSGLIAALRRRPFLRLSGKAWLFLLLGLLLGPGLVANVVFKDHWGRARPREVMEFGGAAHFTSPLVLSGECASNCSFVSGDGAFGFYLPSFAYVVLPRRRRSVFWGGMALGGLFGAARILAGAHFLSDVLFAAVFMLLTSAFLHAVLYGWRETASCWRSWLPLGKRRAVSLINS